MTIPDWPDRTTIDIDGDPWHVWRDNLGPDVVLVANSDQHHLTACGADLDALRKDARGALKTLQSFLRDEADACRTEAP